MANKKIGKVIRQGEHRIARYAAPQASETGNPTLPVVVEEPVTMDAGREQETRNTEHAIPDEAEKSDPEVIPLQTKRRKTKSSKDKDTLPQLLEQSIPRSSEHARSKSEKDLTTEHVEVRTSQEGPLVEKKEPDGENVRSDNSLDFDIQTQGDKQAETGEVQEQLDDDVIEQDGVSDDRTITEALDGMSKEDDADTVMETQSRAPEVSVQVSSDNSDSPLIVMQQKARSRANVKQNKTSRGKKKVSQGSKRAKMHRKTKKGNSEGPSESSIPSNETGVRSVKPLSEKFLSAETKKRFEKFKGVEVLAERNVNVMDFRKNHVWDLFAERQLTGTLTYACSFSKGLVREFYANLTPSTDIPGDFMHYKAFVRGRFIEFSPTIINKLLGTPDDSTQGLEDLPEGTTLEDLEVALTGEYVADRSGKLPIAGLKFESRVMHLIGKTNWLPTRRTDVLQDELALLIFKLLRKEDVNLGMIIYSHIFSRAADMRVRYLLPHPCLIQNIIVRQSPEILADSEITEVIQRPLVIESRVLQAKMSRAQLCSKTFTLLLKHDKQLIQVEKLQRQVTKVVAHIRARQHALWTEFQRGESEGVPSSSTPDKGKENIVEDLMSDSGNEEDADTTEDLSE
ncbi:PREDICTED: uncharacterized protein LOC104820716 [Tarenaya hassleriana]|uniref:uncharacterized protein LOC104820716 n=1 Tax=Tarenaya hassleriana TaxID=28532 RepID=UPI00053C4B08|nr:PREDICTED: uncharacterized protein LOC104820716 [Tarenaya hassleriana]